MAHHRICFNLTHSFASLGNRTKYITWLLILYPLLYSRLAVKTIRLKMSCVIGHFLTFSIWKYDLHSSAKIYRCQRFYYHIFKKMKVLISLNILISSVFCCPVNCQLLLQFRRYFVTYRRTLQPDWMLVF